MGGPPAHELYRDLVQRAGLRLFRDHRGNPYVTLRDGEHRRTFRVPSLELREALDRFRMHRNLRPVPETELAEFTRVVQARVSDPDIFVPTVEAPSLRPLDRDVDTPSAPLPSKERPPTPDGWDEEVSSIAREEADRPLPEAPPTPVARAPSAWDDVVEPLSAPAEVGPALRPSISGGARLPPGEGEVARYTLALRTLMEGGEWLGTTAELARMTGDSPERVFARIREYRKELVRSDIVVVPVETRGGWRWLALDASHLAPSR